MCNVFSNGSIKMIIIGRGRKKRKGEKGGKRRKRALVRVDPCYDVTT